MVGEYDRRRKVMLKRLNDLGLHCFEPRGAFYCFPNITRRDGRRAVRQRRLLRDEKS